MNRLEHLLQTPHISVRRFDHPPGSERCGPEEEVCQDYAIHFVEKGSFQLTVEKTGWLLTAGAVFISRPGAVYRYDHGDAPPSDVCLSVIFSRQFASEISRDERLLPPDAPVALAPTNRLAFLRLRLMDLTSLEDALALESWACEMIAAVRVQELNKGRLYSARQLGWYAERVEAVRELLQQRYADSHSLRSLARSVGMSPFQFARVFRNLTGMPPHQYLLKVRLERAFISLGDGDPVTEVCYQTGFSNLSHFTRSFRRRFGCPPSALKARRYSL
jgi:AraC family transcriptional regulator